MGGTIDFTYDRENDVVIAVPRWNLQTPEDIEGWFRQWCEYFSANFDRKVDLIIDVTNMRLNAKVGALFGEYRVKVHQMYTIRSYRVHCAGTIDFFTKTSAVRLNGPADTCGSIEEALATLKEDRAKSAAQAKKK
jgi:hypothetical protein